MTSNARRSGAEEATPTAGSEEANSRSDRPEHVAAYIADMTTELAKLARSEKLELVAYLLEMANLEASTKMPATRRANPLS